MNYGNSLVYIPVCRIPNPRSSIWQKCSRERKETVRMDRRAPVNTVIIQEEGNCPARIDEHRSKIHHQQSRSDLKSSESNCPTSSERETNTKERKKRIDTRRYFVPWRR